jgi:hypothetical protein
LYTVHKIYDISTNSLILFSNFFSENLSACFLQFSLKYFQFKFFSSNLINFSIKSSQYLLSKNSQVIHSKTVSSNHPHLYAKTGFQAAITSTGTIQKSSSPGNINQLLF